MAEIIADENTIDTGSMVEVPQAAPEESFVNISDNPGWFDKNRDEKSAAISDDFLKVFGDDPDYLNSDPEGRNQYQIAHKQTIEEIALNSQHNPITINKNEKQEQYGDTDVGTQTIVKTGESLINAVQLAKVTHDAIVPDGILSEKTPYNLSVYYQKQDAKIQTKVEKQFDADLVKMGKTMDESGFLGDVGAAYRMVTENFKNNLKAVSLITADSASSLAQISVGANVGAGVAAATTAASGGTLAPLAPFIVAGGIATAEAAEAGGHKFAQLLRTELEGRRIPLTDTNIAEFTKANPELIMKFQKKALKYGSGLGLIDAATGGILARVMGAPTRAARRLATKAAPAVEEIAIAAKKLDMPVDKLTNMIIDGKAKEILKDTTTIKGIAGRKVAHYLGEVASEPLSEAGATAFIGEEQSARELIYETMGGLGGAPMTAAINTSAAGTKLAKKTAVLGATETKEAVTKRARRIFKKQGPLEKEAIADRKARSKRGYREETDAVAASGESVDNISDPEDKENYNPIQAMEILSKSDDENSNEQASQIYKDYWDTSKENIDAIILLKAKKESEGKLSKTEKKELTDREAAHKEHTKTLKILEKYHNVLQQRISKADKDIQIESISAETATKEQIKSVVTKSFGSSGKSTENELTIEQIQTALDRDDIDTPTKKILEDVLALSVTRERFNSRPKIFKTKEEVNHDIFYGQDDFKGIDAYARAISKYVLKGDFTNAKKQLAYLKKFTERHRKKSENLNRLLDIVYQRDNNNRKVTAEEQLALDQSEKDGFRVHGNSGDMVAMIADEVIALDQAMAVAQGIIGESSPQIDSSTSESEKNPPGGTQEAPVDNSANDFPNIQADTKRGVINGYVSQAMTFIKQNKIAYAEKLLADPDAKLTKKQIKLLQNKVALVKKRLEKFRVGIGAPQGTGNVTPTVETPVEQAEGADATEGRRKKDIPVENEQREGDRRKAPEDMTKEELIAALKASEEALRTNDLTGIPNKLAYALSKKGMIQVAIDADSLKWFNDNMGSALGDEMLQHVASALQAEFGENAYHISGDEFTVQGADEKTVTDGLARVEKALAKVVLETTRPNGKKYVSTGVNITFGVNTEGDFKIAESELKANKIAKEKAGTRTPREQQPKGVTITNASKSAKQEAIEALVTQHMEINKELKKEQAKKRKSKKVKKNIERLGVELKSISSDLKDWGINTKAKLLKEMEALNNPPTVVPVVPDKITPAVIAERDDVAGLFALLGVEITADPNYTGTPAEIYKGLAALEKMIQTGVIDKEGLATAFAWIHTKGAKLSPERLQRATYKKVDPVTGKPLTKKQIAANKKKYEQRSKGNPDLYLANQVLEELYELLDSQLKASPENTAIKEAYVEYKKRQLKVARFGSDTIIKDPNSRYNGKTNLEALGQSIAEYQALLENKKGPTAKGSIADITDVARTAVFNSDFTEFLKLPNAQEIYNEFSASLDAAKNQKLDPKTYGILYKKTGNKKDISVPIQLEDPVTKTGTEIVDRISGELFYLVYTKGVEGYGLVSAFDSNGELLDEHGGTTHAKVITSIALHSLIFEALLQHKIASDASGTSGVTESNDISPTTAGPNLATIDTDGFAEYENTELAALPIKVTDQEGITSIQPYNEALSDIRTEIEEFEALKKCLTTPNKTPK